MSASRCIKLLHMLGLHRLDDPNAEFEMMPTIVPPRDWIELEGMYGSKIHLHPPPEILGADGRAKQRDDESSGARLQ